VTRPRHKPGAIRNCASWQGRVAVVERGTRHPLAPVGRRERRDDQPDRAQSPFVALVNPVGTQITWWVLVTPTVGTVTSLQLRTAAGLSGPVVTADSTARQHRSGHRDDPGRLGPRRPATRLPRRLDRHEQRHRPARARQIS
jgi:hypothetical protein